MRPTDHSRPFLPFPCIGVHQYLDEMPACYHPCVPSTSFYVVGFTIITTRPITITYHDTFFSRCAPGLNRVHSEQRYAFEVCVRPPQCLERAGNGGRP